MLHRLAAMKKDQRLASQGSNRKPSNPPSSARWPGRSPWLAAIVLVAFVAVLGGSYVYLKRKDGAGKPSDQAYDSRRPGTLTFGREIAPIIFNHCSRCHRPGQSAPFSLLTYADVKKHSTDIARVTADRYMPPWLPEQGYGEFADERRLTANELSLLQQWIAEGSPEGNPADIPPLPSWKSDWMLGSPDLIVRPEPYPLGAEGKDVYYNFVVPIPTTRNRFVQGVEFMPGDARVVHHAFIQTDATRGARRLGETLSPPGFYGMDTPESVIMPGGQLLGWQPGKLASFNPSGLAWVLYTNTDLVLQVHLNPSGKPEKVQPSVGFYFTDQAPTNSCFRLKLTSPELEIPPGVSNYVTEQSYQLPVDVRFIRIGAHAHYLCKDIQGYVDLPDGKKKWLLWIKDWDFKWQGDYAFKDPVEVPKGSKLTMRFTYDNSTNNVRNPNHPPKHVRWGMQSTDEMAEMYLQALPYHQTDYVKLAKDFSNYFLEVSIKHFTHLLQIDPNDAYAHKRLGRALAGKGMTGEGIAHLKKAIALKPNEDEAHYDLGSILLRLKRAPEAFAEFQEAARLNPRDYQSLGSMGIIAAQAGRLPEAEAYFLEALRVNPDDPLAQRFLETIRSKLRR